jgi:hypothetical protein
MLLYIAIGITAFVLLRRYAILDPPEILPEVDAKPEPEPVPSY